MQRRKIRRLEYLSCALIGCAIAWGIYAMTKRVDEVIPTLGEPYENVHAQSHPTLPPIEPDISVQRTDNAMASREQVPGNSQHPMLSNRRTSRRRALSDYA